MAVTKTLAKEHPNARIENGYTTGSGEVVLSQAAMLLRAPLFKDENVPGGAVFKVLSVIDIKDYGHTAYPGKEIRIRNLYSKAQKYCLKPYDVVISIVGSVGKVCIIPETVPENWIPTSNMLIIRFKENKIDQAIAFAMLMHSHQGRNILERLVHGNKISMISKKEFSRVKIPALTEENLKEARILFNKEESLAQKIEECLSEISSVRESCFNA